MKLYIFSTLLFIGSIASALSCPRTAWVDDAARNKAEQRCTIPPATSTGTIQVKCGPSTINVAFGKNGQYGKLQISNKDTVDRGFSLAVVNGQGAPSDVVYFVKAGQTCDDSIEVGFKSLNGAISSSNRALLQRLGLPPRV